MVILDFTWITPSADVKFPGFLLYMMRFAWRHVRFEHVLPDGNPMLSGHYRRQTRTCLLPAA